MTVDRTAIYGRLAALGFDPDQASRWTPAQQAVILAAANSRRSKDQSIKFTSEADYHAWLARKGDR